MDCDLIIVQSNVNSLQSKVKKIEFEQFLKKHSPDLIMLTENKLNEKNSVSFHGYKIVRNDRLENNGGGTAICYKEHLFCGFFATPKKIKTFECCILNLKTKSEKNVIFASIYKPPSRKENGKTIPIKIKLSEIFNIQKNALYVVGGNFDAHHPTWNSNAYTQNGNDIIEWYDQHKDACKISIYASKNPTCSRSLNGSHIDFGFISTDIEVKNSNNIKQLSSEPFSDHAAIFLESNLLK